MPQLLSFSSLFKTASFISKFKFKFQCPRYTPPQFRSRTRQFASKSTAPASSPAGAVNGSPPPAPVPAPAPVPPVSVNYFLTRECNYQCAFCFHTAKTSEVLPMDEAKRGLKLLVDAGMKKLNFAGGEPFIHEKGTFIGELSRYGKEELGLESISVISNGSLIREKWLKEYAAFIDIMAISCDSFDCATLFKIGRIVRNRRTESEQHVRKLFEIREWCSKYGLLFKVNTVVCTHNMCEDMNDTIRLLDPVRWKLFQVLLLEGENTGGEDSLRNATELVVSEQEFDAFVDRHQRRKCMVAENNAVMKDSYLLLDEQMRFLDCSNGGKEPSESILRVGVGEAMGRAGWDDRMFKNRGGIFEWKKRHRFR